MILTRGRMENKRAKRAKRADPDPKGITMTDPQAHLLTNLVKIPTPRKRKEHSRNE